MHLDILIFAIIAAFLVYRLKMILGTRHGAERDRPNPFDAAAAALQKQNTPSPAGRPVIDGKAKPAPTPINAAHISTKDNVDGRIHTGLDEIAAVDSGFDVDGFMQGARMAFEMIVTAYAKGSESDLETLKSLLSPKLYKDFTAGIATRQSLNHSQEVTIHRITAARIIEAHLGGAMAYITVDYDVEQTTVTRDKDGNVVDGNPDKIFSVEDIWTFTRDTRSNDLSWTLIETRTP